MIVDVRYNRGGHVSPLLVGKTRAQTDRLRYASLRCSGSVSARVGRRPDRRPYQSVCRLRRRHLQPLFKLFKLGPLVGKRTWGGVIGIDPYHHLVDGTLTTQPEFSFWFVDVGWGVENHGTDPDFDVDVAPHDYRDGKDPQLELALELMDRALEPTSSCVPISQRVRRCRCRPWREAGRPLVLLAAFALPAAVYVACVSPEPGAWDTAELQGVPYILGISHPTGFPLYVLLGFAWSHAIAIGSVAWRMNVMSAVVMAVVARGGFRRRARVRREHAGRARRDALVFVHAERMVACDPRRGAESRGCLCALAVYAFVRWLRGARDRWFVAAFALAGLGMAAHPNALWILPALLGGAAIAKRRPPARIVAGSFGLVIAGLLLYAYLPLRSAYVVAHHLDPASALPGYRGGIFWNYNDPSTPSGLALELTGTESKTPSYFLASLNPVHLGTALWTFVAGLRSEYGIVAAALAVAGFGAACRRDWRGALVLGVACTAGLVFSVVYPNESDVGRYRLLASWIAVPLFGALTPQSRRGFSLVLHVALIVFLLAGAAMSFQRQLSFFRHAPAEGGRWVISNVRPYVPPGAVIVTTWLDATSLAYGAYVDGTLPGRIVLSDDRFDGARYRGIAKSRRVFVLVNPHQVKVLNGAEDYATLDPYHELYTVTP